MSVELVRGHVLRQARLTSLLRTVQMAFWCQYPPTVRVQPPDPIACGRMHRDSEYGHQPGEINFWMPLTRLEHTRTSLVTLQGFERPCLGAHGQPIGPEASVPI